MGEKDNKITAYDEKRVSVVSENAYILVEENNLPIVEKAFVTCNQSVTFADQKIKICVSAESNNVTNGASGLRESDIALKPERFGLCYVTEEQCEPEIEGKRWQACDQTHRINGEASVTMNSYMVCLKGGIIAPLTDGQRIEELMEQYKDSFVIQDISKKYLRFLEAYECMGDEWRYAQDPGDGTITIAFGVVLKDRDGKIYDQVLYDEWTKRRAGSPMTWDEAVEITKKQLQENINKIKETAKKEGWNLDQNRYDAILDMTWNLGNDALGYKATELLATGDLNDEKVIAELQKEILETAHAELENKNKTGLENQWSKNLVERRLDLIRMAQGGEDAYTKNEIDSQLWNDKARELLIGYGMEEKIIDKYTIQEVQDD